MSGWALPASVAAVLAAGAAAACILLLGIAWPLGLAIGAAVGAGGGLLMLPTAPRPLEVAAPEPTTVAGSLDAVQQRCAAMTAALRRPQSRPLWAGTDVDERLAGLVDRVRTLGRLPELGGRTRLDGDVRMLYQIAADYLPAVVNLAIDNDRMHSAFAGARSREQVERNVRDLEEQVAILSEVLDRIETDVVRGTTQSIQEHEAFLRLRFEQAGATPVLDLTERIDPEHPST
ncbi:hypothetical protein [Gulosibacter sp. 10]|uniref:hypothetical protein n=1 Tax=Gulosibacter sp. 10 TaxID=1255570 RepID=UPI00097E7918|nr:hypothetical protein [Gulosibacter sp. 10]SJM57062.1 hypothetical protein FM112_05040 [Gulosibacter sp. 10]